MDVSIVTINYNSSDFTLECIKSILERTDGNNLKYEIIIVDNGSQKSDYENLLKGLETIKTLIDIRSYRSVINTGFGGGNMMGVQHAKGKYYAFLNNDIILKNDCISMCLEFIENNNAAVLAPIQLDENEKYMSSFDYFLTVRRELIGRSLLHQFNSANYPDRHNRPEKPIKVDCVAGSFMFIDGEAFDNVGGFDTNIFLYYEETDLCYRILKKTKNGYCYLLPHASYIHYSGTSTKKSLPIKTELKRSMLYVLKKHSSLLSFKIFECTFIVKWFFKALFKPSYFPFLRNLIMGESPAFSLKNQQKINR